MRIRHSDRTTLAPLSSPQTPAAADARVAVLAPVRHVEVAQRRDHGGEDDVHEPPPAAARGKWWDIEVGYFELELL